MTDSLDAQAQAAMAAYRLSPRARLEPVPGGLINRTFVVRDDAGQPAAILQRLHPVFAPEVNLDIDAVTAHVAAAGLDTPRLVRAASGAAWVEVEGSVWRALTYVDGVTVHEVEDPEQARSAGELTGKFHRALADLRREFAFSRSGVHDTAARLARLERAVASHEDPAFAEAKDFGREILDVARRLPPLPPLPARITHGDLKISNVLFRRDDPRAARCLIDLDTLGRQTIAYELGDALRSWCNRSGENAAEARFDVTVYSAALAGYAAGSADLLSTVEIDSISRGVETVAVELAARFCTDAFEDHYFGWDPRRFSSRRAHNLVRARGQLALAQALAAARAETALLARRAFHR